MEHIVYILSSKKLNRFYIGYSANFDKRMKYHQNAEARKFTYKADDWEVFMLIECSSETQGLAIEKHIKQMKSRVFIQNLKKYPELKVKLIERYITDC